MWGSVFWRQEYARFSEISLPRGTADCPAVLGQNPGLLLDFYRFCSDVQVEFLCEQSDVIRRYDGERPTTHDLMYGLRQKPCWVLDQASGPGG